MPSLRRYLPFLDLAGYRRSDLSRDVSAALAVVFLAVPQGIAYAVIAGLPPAMGLYAAAIPTIIGALFVSSRHVVAGPTNALSLLVGAGVAALGGDPVVVAGVLALQVGVMQLLAGVLQLGAVVDFVSGAVLRGYVSGAAVLIAVGQLGHVTATEIPRAGVFQRIGHWAGGLGDTNLVAVGIALITVVAILVMRRTVKAVPATVVVLGAGIVAQLVFELGAMGVPLVRDLSPIPAGLPPLAWPELGDWRAVLPLAGAATVLSLVESSAVARTLAGRTGQRLDPSVGFVGHGLANIAAAVSGGYPTSGSLARSTLNERSGARTRLSGVLSGVFMFGVLLLLGPIVDLTPVPVVAGMVLVVAADLLDVRAISTLMRSDAGDRLAFVATMAGTFWLPLDQAIYLGVGISLVLFLRRARLLHVRELVVDKDHRIREADPERRALPRCTSVRVLHVEGALFFGSARELVTALEEAVTPEVRVLVVRLKRTWGLDYTTATAIREVGDALATRGVALLLVGMRPPAVDLLERTGIATDLGVQNLFPTRPGWFVAMDQALIRALELTADATHQQVCPIEAYLATRDLSPGARS